VDELGEQVQSLLANETAVALGERERYYINLQERRIKKARVALSQVREYLMPTARDREAFPLRGRFSAILYLIRPIRLIWEYGLDPFGRFFKAIFEGGTKENEFRTRD
jgi:hypothetical protein